MDVSYEFPTKPTVQSLMPPTTSLSLIRRLTGNQLRCSVLANLQREMKLDCPSCQAAAASCKTVTLGGWESNAPSAAPSNKSLPYPAPCRQSAAARSQTTCRERWDWGGLGLVFPPCHPNPVLPTNGCLLQYRPLRAMGRSSFGPAQHPL